MEGGRVEEGGVPCLVGKIWGKTPACQGVGGWRSHAAWVCGADVTRQAARGGGLEGVMVSRSAARCVGPWWQAVGDLACACRVCIGPGGASLHARFFLRRGQRSMPSFRGASCGAARVGCAESCVTPFCIWALIVACLWRRSASLRRSKRSASSGLTRIARIL